MGHQINNPKRVATHVRLDAECESILAQYCEQEQIAKTEAIRRGIKKLKDELRN